MPTATASSSTDKNTSEVWGRAAAPAAWPSAVPALPSAGSSCGAGEHLSRPGRPAAPAPSPSSTILAARLASPRMSCVTVSTVRPVLARTASSSCRNDAHPLGILTGRRLVQNQYAGRADQQRASASRCLPPWLSSHGLTCSSPRKPKNSMASSTSSTGSGGSARNLLPNLQLADDGLLEQHLVGCLQQQGHLRRVLEDLARPDRLARGIAPDPHSACPCLPSAPVRVLLPEPFAPIIATHSPSATWQGSRRRPRACASKSTLT